MRLFKFKNSIFITILTITLIVIVLNHILFKQRPTWLLQFKSQKIPPASLTTYLTFKSSCECKKNKYIVIEGDSSDPQNERLYSIISLDTQSSLKTHLYTLNAHEFESSRFTCDLYKVLRRGRGQKVISLSLFGNDSFFYEKLYDISKQAKQLYSDWVIRVYYDDSINKKIICDLECALEEANVDFCYINEIKLKLTTANLQPSTTIINASYVLPRKWRFLAMGDSFVDLFVSRDSDSYILQR